MKKIVFFFFVFYKVFSQDVEYLKSRDTLYFVFDDSNTKETKIKSKKFSEFHWSQTLNEYQSHYEIKDTKGKVFIFSVNKKDTSRFAPITMDKVSFLEAHKEELICLRFIKGFTPEELFFQYFGQVRGAPSPKVIYIVDRKSLKRKSKQIIMRRAFLTNVGYSEM